jgi:signal transduction histidine kinase
VVRDVASELRPYVLDLGIDSALEWLTEKFIEQSGIPSELNLAAQELVMDDEYATAIFRIVQEALDNVARHADATSVAIALECRGGEYFLEVRDDGRGFDLDTPKEKTLGLLGIQERVGRLGGTMAISSAPGKGTVLGVRMPVRWEAA